ncbi:MAG: hypothetical protein AAGA48_21225 [Myxococcota bacterium]
MTNRDVEWAPDGFTAPLVKPETDGWWGVPLRFHSRDALVSVMIYLLEVLGHWWTVRPWASWSLSLRRGRLVLRLRGRRQTRFLAELRHVRTDDYGMTLGFDDGEQWTVPAQPTGRLDLFELADHLRIASESARDAVFRDVEAANRARAALRGIRSAAHRDGR